MVQKKSSMNWKRSIIFCHWLIISIFLVPLSLDVPNLLFKVSLGNFSLERMKFIQSQFPIRNWQLFLESQQKQHISFPYYIDITFQCVTLHQQTIVEVFWYHSPHPAGFSSKYVSLACYIVLDIVIINH